jgi:peptide/nickel transport system ATP-binding protein
MTGRPSPTTAPALEVDDLVVEFRTDAGVARAVGGVSFRVVPGETLAIVGESGSGKSVTALAVMGLLPSPGRVAGGDVRFGGRSLVGLADAEYRRVRGGAIGMIFQDPLSSLHPSFRVGNQIAEALRVHGTCPDKASARARAVQLLERVGFPDATRRARDFPHQLSGGMRQRVMIAMAIANSPSFLIADEPTTALDVTVQAQVLDVLREAQRETDVGLVLITHDLGVVAGIADRVAVMYAGRFVETGTLDDVFYRPRHPYTVGLLAAVPRLDAEPRVALSTIPGSPPSPSALPPGCALAPRCPNAVADCDAAVPVLEPVPGRAHESACIRRDDATIFGAPRAPHDEPGSSS